MNWECLGEGVGGPRLAKLAVEAVDRAGDGGKGKEVRG